MPRSAGTMPYSTCAMPGHKALHHRHMPATGATPGSLQRIPVHAAHSSSHRERNNATLAFSQSTSAAACLCLWSAHCCNISHLMEHTLAHILSSLGVHALRHILARGSHNIATALTYRRAQDDNPSRLMGRTSPQRLSSHAAQALLHIFACGAHTIATLLSSWSAKRFNNYHVVKCKHPSTHCCNTYCLVGCTYCYISAH